VVMLRLDHDRSFGSRVAAVHPVIPALRKRFEAQLYLAPVPPTRPTKLSHAVVFGGRQVLFKDHQGALETRQDVFSVTDISRCGAQLFDKFTLSLDQLATTVHVALRLL